MCCGRMEDSLRYKEQDIDKRRELESRGIVLAAELIENGETPIRIGQCWELDGRVY